MEKHKNNGIFFQLHPHRHTESCRTDETETSGDLSCLLHFEVGNAKYLRSILPTKGNIRMLQVTEKQYARMEILLGNN
jgi:hypothetical protein